MLKWLGRKRPMLKVDRLSHDRWRADRHPSLCLVVTYWLSERQQTDAVFDSGSTALAAAGFAHGWTSPLADGPEHFAHLDIHTIERFVRLQTGEPRRHLAEVTIEETVAYDLLYRSGIDATGISFTVSLHNEAAVALRDYLHAHELNAPGHRGGSFAIRLPVEKRFEFPEPRGSETPYESGPSANLQPLRQLAKFSSDWIEVAAIKEHPSDDALKSAPLCDLFSTSEVQRISSV